jgi:CheY-like chemotaxis protein
LPKKQIRVVIVEDFEPTLYLIKKAFDAKSQNVDWDLCFARDGEEALDCILQRGKHSEAPLPDLVLLDWNLPKVSGQQVLHTLKQSEELRTIPVLVFSASDAPEAVHAAYSGHANGYIPKPSDLDRLYSIIESIESFWVHTARLHPITRPQSRSGVPPQSASAQAKS